MAWIPRRYRSSLVKATQVIRTLLERWSVRWEMVVSRGAATERQGRISRNPVALLLIILLLLRVDNAHSADSSIRSTRNLRGSRTDVIHSTDPSRHHRNNDKVVEPAVKSPNKDEKKRKRFLRWAGDDNQETIEDRYNNSRSMEEARDMGAAAPAVGTATDSHLRTSREGVVLVDAVGEMDRSGGLPGESRKSADIGQGVDLNQSLRRRRA